MISPMGIGEVLDTGFNLARQNYRWLVGITAWGAVPSYAVFALGGVVMGSLPARADSPTGIAVVGFGIAMLLFAIGTMLTSAALIIACGRLVTPTGNAEERTAGELYGEATGRFFTMVRLGLLYAITALPLMIVFPLGVYVWVRWSIAWVAVLLEGTGARDSLRRSWSLTAGSWWHTAVVIFGSSLIVSILSGMIGGLLGGGGALLALMSGNKTIEPVLNASGQGIGFILVEAFAAAILGVLYYELRARTEGFDLEQRGIQIAQNP